MKYLLLTFILLSSITQAQLEIGSLSLENQHGDTQSISDDVTLVIFSYDMAGKDIVNNALKEQKKGFLSEHNAMCVADIEKMPGIIARLFAYPAMREYSYNIMLDKDGKATKDWPRKEDNISLLRIKQGKLISHTFYSDANLLLNAIKNNK